MKKSNDELRQEYKREALGKGTRGKYLSAFEPVGKLKVIPDFLPPPEQLVFREQGVKVTLTLSKKSVAFFKSEAVKHDTQYQRMIRRLIDSYVEVYSAPAKSSRATAGKK